MSHPIRFAAAALALTLAAAAPPPPKTTVAPAPPKPADDTLFVTLKGVINRGADLYNDGEPAACYRLYEGSLMTIRPTLDRYPELQKAIASGLRAAERDPVMWRRAFTLRDVLDKVRAELNPAKAKDAPKALKKDEKADPDKDQG